MKIGIYGGTFDPPHIGHINAAISGKKQVGAEKLLLIPAFRRTRSWPDAPPAARTGLK